MTDEQTLIFWTAVQSIGTVAAAVATFIAVVVALTALVLDRQTRARDAREAQARHISAWLGGRGVRVSNASEQAIYRVVIWRVLSSGLAGPKTGEEMFGRFDEAEVSPPTKLPADDTTEDDPQPAFPFSEFLSLEIVPRGEWTAEMPPWIGGGMFRSPGIEIAFTDSAGRHWIRRVTGSLEPISKDPTQHYGLFEPVHWSDLVEVQAPGAPSAN